MGNTPINMETMFRLRLPLKHQLLQSLRARPFHYHPGVLGRWMIRVQAMLMKLRSTKMSPCTRYEKGSIMKMQPCLLLQSFPSAGSPQRRFHQRLMLKGFIS